MGDSHDLSDGDPQSVCKHEEPDGTRRGEIHLLLADMVMPGGITGKDLGERFLKDNPKLKIIYTSGYSPEIAGKNFELKEGVNFLSKPFAAAKLAETVRNSLEQSL